ncbi:hypothetical protein ACWCPQ_22680 [Nocardia sp. NPDC001965]
MFRVGSDEAKVSVSHRIEGSAVELFGYLRTHLRNDALQALGQRSGLENRGKPLLQKGFDIDPIQLGAAQLIASARRVNLGCGAESTQDSPLHNRGGRRDAGEALHSSGKSGRKSRIRIPSGATDQAFRAEAAVV